MQQTIISYTKLKNGFQNLKSGFKIYKRRGRTFKIYKNCFKIFKNDYPGIRKCCYPEDFHYLCQQNH